MMMDASAGPSGRNQHPTSDQSIRADAQTRARRKWNKAQAVRSCVWCRRLLLKGGRETLQCSAVAEARMSNWSGLELLHPIAQSGAIGHTCVARGHLTSAEGEERGDTLNAILLGGLWIFVDVYFDEARSGLQGLGRLCKDRCHRAAWSTPRRPKIGDHWNVGVCDVFLQLAGVDVDRATQKKRRVTAATLSSFGWSIRRNGIDAITVWADYSALLGHRMSSRSADAALNLGVRPSDRQWSACGACAPHACS